LPDVVKTERVKSLKGHFEEEDEGFLHQIVTGDENWVHHYDSEKKRWFVEYLQKVSPMPEKFKTQASAGKVMLTVF